MPRGAAPSTIAAAKRRRALRLQSEFVDAPGGSRRVNLYCAD
jgi:hypothetical protein